MSQRTHLPADHGTKVQLSRRLPSIHVNSVGSLTAGITARHYYYNYYYFYYYFIIIMIVIIIIIINFIIIILTHKNQN